MKLLNVEIADFKRIEVVEFQPAGEGSTLVAGMNEQGKSSTIDAIAAALGGAKELPAEPVRRGQKKSKTKLELGDESVDFVIEHEITATGRKLTVRNAEGSEQKAPQALLDSLYSRVAFDPLSFTRAKPEDQDRILKELAGVAVPFAKLDADRKVLYDKRTEQNRLAAQAKARAEGMPRHPKAPVAETSVAELAREIAAAQEHAHARRSAEDALDRQAAEVERQAVEVEKLKVQLKTAEDKHRAEALKLNQASDALAALAPNVDTTELQEKLNNAETINAQVRANLARKEEEKRAEKLQAESEALTAQIEAIDAEKQALLAAAEFPVEGLGFNDLGPTLHGVPLEQASTARKLDLSVAIGIAQHPKLKLLLIREGAFLDEDALARIDQRAREAGAQLLIERVGTRDKGSNVVIIENGLVKSQSTAAE